MKDKEKKISKKSCRKESKTYGKFQSGPSSHKVRFSFISIFTGKSLYDTRRDRARACVSSIVVMAAVYGKGVFGFMAISFSDEARFKAVCSDGFRWHF